jgi:hypothetical protein
MRINELLTLSRLPVALWTNIHGGHEVFGNPGKSVLSFCVRYLSMEYMTIPDQIVESIQQCRDFSTKREHIAVILEFLEVKAASLAGDANGLPDLERSRVFHEMAAMVRLSQETKKLAQSFEVNSMMPMRLDASSQMYPTFIQAILEMCEAMSILEEKIAGLKLPPPIKA